MASSAVYRYFPSRDDLLTALIVDAYDALGLAVEGTARWETNAEIAAPYSERPSPRMRVASRIVATTAPVRVMNMASRASPADRSMAEAHMPSTSGGHDGSTMLRYSCASVSVRPPAPSEPSSAGSAGQSAATRSDDVAPANTAACEESRRARAMSRAPSAGATKATTAIDMPMPAEIKKNMMLLA